MTPGFADPARPAYDFQFKSGTAFDGWRTTRITDGVNGAGTVLAGSPSTALGETTLILPSGGGVQLARVRMARPITGYSVTHLLGEVILPPLVDANGQDVPPGFYQPQPANIYTNPPANTDVNPAFYFSPHAQVVYATQPGVVVVNWKARVSGIILRQTYVVSSSPVKPERKILWTEKGFNGPKINVPPSRVGAINIVYNSFVPRTVPTQFASPYDTPGVPGAQLPPELRTLWYDSLDGLIHAYNRQGRVFVEYLGNLDANGVTREQLGFEIVNLQKEVRPTTLRADIGNTVVPPSGPDPDLSATIVAGLNNQGSPYLHEHISLGGTKRVLYSIRATAPGVIANGVEQQVSNEVLIYWLERGVLDLRWPKHYTTYIQQWPASLDRYSLYARPDAGSAEGAQASLDTAVPLDSANNPALVYQDDPGSQQAKLAAGNLFRTDLTATDPDNRALIRFSRDEDIWFERIFSRISNTFDTRQLTAAFDPADLFVTGSTGIGSVSLFDINDPSHIYVEGVDYVVNYQTGVITRLAGGSIPAGGQASVTFQVFQNGPVASPTVLETDIGERIKPPTGASDSLIGYIRQPVGTAFDPTAYKDPFVNGFIEAAKGAIIGVNALPGNDRLEVWWYRKSRPPGTKLTGTFWPSFVQRYHLRWPAAPPQIVLASNAGSDALPSLQASGSIYFQNNSALPGYNPNEEHAVMINGRAWALRDDLNIATSSQPYVLVSYKEADARPAMAVFQVLRENATYTFNYDAVAGIVLQSPMPLPILPLPIKPDRKVANYEVQPAAPADPAPGFDAARDAAFAHYQRFTYEDRKGTHWVYRGPHGGNGVAPAPELRMRYFYQTQPGFYFPSLGAQPALGTIVPYLRPGTPGAYAGDPATGIPLDIVFKPKWPASVPELRISETLTTAKLGLPAVRGQTSAELLYQQSVASDTPGTAFLSRKKSARLYDPTRAKKYALSASTLAALPDSLKTSPYLGKTYFPNLPPHLSQRLYFDPNEGTKGSLILIGEFKAETTGEDYLQLNVLSAADVLAAKALCQTDDTSKASWDAAIDGLQTTVETFIEDPARRGTYIADNARDVTVGPTDISEVTDDDSAVDSYAVAGSGGGQGYVVLMVGNGCAFTPPGEPVSFQVFRVTPPLYRGELKVITPSNPLDEKLTLQQSADFAGHPEDYEFEWRYAPPADGVPPLLFTFQRALLLGDSTGAPATVWTLFRNPIPGYENLRAPDADVSEGIAVALPGQPIVVNDGNGTSANGTTRPNAILRRTIDVSRQPFRLYLSLSLGLHEGVVAYINSARVATRRVPGQTDSIATVSPGADFNPLPLIFEIDPNALKSGVNVITLELYSDGDPNVPTTVNARLEGANETENIAAWILLPPGPDEGTIESNGSVRGKVRHTIQGNSILTLTDNYFIMRYRARNADNAAFDGAGGGWSKWVTPQLAEGWIKRALAGINPFQQRVTDLFNNPVDTDVSLVMQAGRRWEGDIALNLQNINDFGLIEIYETILRRGRSLSIEGTPAINYDGANDALLLAAGYLSDLYSILGNEAFADAANPTIAFGLDNGLTFGDAATSLFAFKGEVATLMDEELGLLRGRDDFLQPGARVAPFYNRLVWNYTRGILSGEAIYALNYNIRDLTGNGDVDEADAAKLFPQGHGDAYGHYLTALTGYYSLLRNPNFSWVPRTEAVLVGGVPVQVDYLDERKFAGAAAALARTASQTLDLTYRQAFTAAETVGWSNLRDGRVNVSTGQVRTWGTDDWASRAGQGAYLHWVTANSLLPAVDPNPNHEGIQKIDRTTVPELAEIVGQATAIQQTLDNADARLNPLGLSRGALAFDISPTEIDAGKTHYEQVYGRAVTALQNAVTAFGNAKDSTQFLRRQEESLAGQRSAIAEQERAFTNQLIEIYGTPYPDDVGPGRTYQQGYTGPDLFHPMYVEITEDLAGGNFTPIAESSYTLYTAMSPASVAMANGQLAPTGTVINPNNPSQMVEVPAGSSGVVEYTLEAISGRFRKPAAWTGRRASPGRIQTAVSNELLARQNFFGQLYDFNRQAEVMSLQLELYRSALNAHETTLSLLTTNHAQSTALETVNTALATVSRLLQDTIDVAEIVKDAVDEGTPKVVGLATDPSFAGRLAANGAYGTIVSLLKAAQATADTQQDINDQIKNALDRLLTIDLENAGWANENKQLILGLRESLQEFIEQSGGVDATYRQYDQAKRDLASVEAEGLRVQQSREVFRQRAAAIIQGFRTKDVAFRSFRNEALEKYKTLFDLAGRYTFLAARAYDYETGLLNPNGSSAASSFYEKILRARALGVMSNGQPQFAGSNTGDPGLSGVLAQMSGDWSVVKTRLGFNNPDRYRTTFSLRNELHRVVNGPTGLPLWKDKLRGARVTNIMEDPDVKRYCMQAADPTGQPVPGLIISFESMIETGMNFFGRPLAGGDHTFTPSSFATKIRSSGIAFAGYVGMDSPTTTSGALTGIGATSPGDPNTGFTSPNALSATPYVYLIPTGSDTLRAPPLGDVYTRRTWTVEDQAIPLPFNIANSDFSTNRSFISASSLTEPAFTVRKHQAFRAVPDGTNFSSGVGFTNSRLIGRSAWNTQWKLVIPGNTLLSDPNLGVQTFIETVSDIKLHLETYSYSGN